MSDKCEVKAYYGVLGTKKDRNGKPMEVRLCKVSWRGSKPMWDRRAWSADEEPMKGITMTDEMMQHLKEIVESIDFGA